MAGVTMDKVREGSTAQRPVDKSVSSGKVFITRHGERADLADEAWLAHAEVLGENIQQIYSSPFFRTVQTAQEVASCIGDNVTIRIEDGLAEGMLTRLFPAGRPNFQTPEELKSTCKSVDSHYKSLLHISFPEDYSDSQARCRQIARQLADRHPHDNVLLVAHGLSVEYLASALVTNQKCSLHIPYCCLTECIRGPDGEWMYGLHMDQEFLSSKQEKSDADKQREMWGLDEANP
ncbi:MAG: hypothetical protein FRX49_03198 [Trebouxia sp. A1-2]|nr:MAG: hypothetical protein FRX49_03198 [Trebouxia sp. A1-2]